MERSPSYFLGFEEEELGDGTGIGPAPAPYPKLDSHSKRSDKLLGPAPRPKLEPLDEIAALPNKPTKSLLATPLHTQGIEDSFQNLSEGSSYDPTHIHEYTKYSSHDRTADPSVEHTPILHTPHGPKGTSQYLNQTHSVPPTDANLRPEYYTTVQHPNTHFQTARTEPGAPRGLPMNEPRGSTTQPNVLDNFAHISFGNNTVTNPHNQDMGTFHNVPLGLPTPSRTYINPLQEHSSLGS